MEQINIAALVPSTFNVRTQNNTDDHLQLLASNIAQHGLLHAPTVRRMANGTYEIIAGLRRVQAVKLLGWTTVPCMVLNETANDVFQLSFSENMQRRNMLKRDICRAIERYVTPTGPDQPIPTLQDVATMMQLTLPTVRRYALVAQLDDATLDRLDATDDTYLTLQEAETMARALANPPEYTEGQHAAPSVTGTAVAGDKVDGGGSVVGGEVAAEGPPVPKGKKPRKKPTKSEPWIYNSNDEPIPIPPHLFAPILQLVTAATT